MTNIKNKRFDNLIKVLSILSILLNTLVIMLFVGNYLFKEDIQPVLYESEYQKKFYHANGYFDCLGDMTNLTDGEKYVFMTENSYYYDNKSIWGVNVYRMVNYYD